MSEMDADAAMAAASASADAAEPASSSSSGSASGGGSSSAALDPQLLPQLQQHLAHTVPPLVQGNVAVFNQYCSTKETEVRTERAQAGEGHAPTAPRRLPTATALAPSWVAYWLLTGAYMAIVCCA